MSDKRINAIVQMFGTNATNIRRMNGNYIIIDFIDCIK